MSQLNTLKEQEISTFGTNEWKLQDDDAKKRSIVKTVLAGPQPLDLYL